MAITSDKAVLDAFVDRWVRVSGATGKLKREEVELWLPRAYEAVGLSMPSLVLYADSPVGALLMRRALAAIYEGSKKRPEDIKPADAKLFNQTRENLFSQLSRAYGERLDDVYPVLWGLAERSHRVIITNAVQTFFKDNLPDPKVFKKQSPFDVNDVEDMWRKVCEATFRYANPLRDHIASLAQDISEVEVSFISHMHDAGSWAFVEYMVEQCANTSFEKLLPFCNLARACGWWLPLKGCVIVTPKPRALHLNDRGQLHCDGGPAAQYPDEWSMWCLNGVRVSREMAETPGDALDVQLITKETNAEVRRELVRKIGNDRICRELKTKVIDRGGKGMYELVDLDLGDGRQRPFLKMLNPSTGDTHFEGVPPNVRTVADALTWRNGTEERPSVLT